MSGNPFKTCHVVMASAVVTRTSALICWRRPPPRAVVAEEGEEDERALGVHQGAHESLFLHCPLRYAFLGVL